MSTTDSENNDFRAINMLNEDSLYTKETEFKQFLRTNPNLDEVLNHTRIQEEVLAGNCELCKLVNEN